MTGPGEVNNPHEPLFKCFEAVFADPKFAPTQSLVVRHGGIAVRRSGVTGSNVGVLEAMRGLEVDCYRYHTGYDADPTALRYEAQTSRYGLVVVTLAFSESASYERDESAKLQQLDPDEARNTQVAARYVLRNMQPR